MASVAAPAVRLSNHHRRLGGYRTENPPSLETGGRCRSWSSAPFIALLPFPRRRLPSLRPLVLRCVGAASAGEGRQADLTSTPSPSAMPPSDNEKSTNNANSSESYVGLFVRMLGLDNDPLDREQAAVTLWKYAQGGKSCVDAIMKFPGCINLVISLLKSESNSTSEAAAGLLRSISAVSLYRDIVAERGAIEEISTLLCQSCLAAEVKEQCLFTLWNISTDEKHRLRIAESFLLPVIVKFLSDDDLKVKEAAGGILANLALSPSTHSTMVEAGVILKLAELLKSDQDDYKVIRKEAKTSLLELAKDEYYRVLIAEEGLLRVPVIGSKAYESFRPLTHSWPSLPDGVEIPRNSAPSRYGATELLLGLNLNDKKFDLDESKTNAIVGRSQQQFLARIGAIELDGARKPNVEPSPNQYTLLQWIDGVARLVLILDLEDVSGITKAAYAIADASINENLRISFKEAGAVKRLIQLLHHDDESVKEAVAHALDKLSLSHIVRKTMQEGCVVDPLVKILKEQSTSEVLVEKAMNILSRICDSNNDMVTKDLCTSKNSQDIDGFINVPAPSTSSREMEVDTELVSRLINILKTSSPSLQIKAASILEYLLMLEPDGAVVNSGGIALALNVVFEKACALCRRHPNGADDDFFIHSEDLTAEAEDIGLATAAGSRLLAKLLDFAPAIDTNHFTDLLRKVLKSPIPLRTKDWVAACLVKLNPKVTSASEANYPIFTEVTIYEKIPRLVEQMMASDTLETREAAVIELNKIISRGDAECTKAVAAVGGIFPLVKLIEDGRGDALEAGLAILYNLSMDIENHSAIIAAGVVPILKRIVRSEGPQWTRALRLLRTLPT